MASERLLLRAHGVLYGVEIESETADLDWLDRVILEVAAEPRNVSDFISCFGLPRRMIEDAIGRLVERHLLLLDVSRAQVRASGIDPAASRSGRSRSTLLLWQDHATGVVLPWEQVKSLNETHERTGGELKRLPGGPPAKTVLEMSDAELLARLERFRRDSAWTEVIVGRERLQSKTLVLAAERRQTGAIVLLDIVPHILVRSWGRFPALRGIAEEQPPRVLLPRSWLEVSGDWLKTAEKRIYALENSSAPRLPECSLELTELRETIERSYTLELVADGAAFTRQRVQPAGGSAADVRLVVATSTRLAGYGDAIPILRQTRASKKLLLLGGEAKPQNKEGVRQAGGTLLETVRDDVEFVFLNDRELVVGGVRHGVHYALRLKSLRPIHALAAWPPEISDRGSLARPAQYENRDRLELIRDLLAFDNVLREKAVSSASASPAQSGSPADQVQQLRSGLDELVKRLAILNLVRAVPMDGDEVLGAIREYQGGRVLVRDHASPLAREAHHHEVVVCASAQPPPGVRWIQEPAPAEIVILGDVVIFGWWKYEQRGEGPPFFACHAPAIATALCARTDRAAMVKP